MTETRNIFLIGLMGAGKTTIGRQIARELNLPFEDSDRVIEERTGITISLIFSQEGEAGFRAREKNVIHELTARSGIVLATGGGAVIDSENRQLLSARGFVVYLRAPVAVLVARTAHDHRRPLLQDSKDRQARFQQLLEIRDPLYREIAHLILDTGVNSVRRVVRELLKHLEKIRTAPR